MFEAFAKLLKVPFRAAEDAIHSEKLAQAHLSRRALLGGGLALLTGKTFGIPNPATEFLSLPLITIPEWADLHELERTPVITLTNIRERRFSMIDRYTV